MTDHELQQDINLALADDEQTLWGSRLVKKSLFDADGSTLGSIQDILLVPAASENRLYLRGFVASVDRRLIFVHEARVDAVDRDGLHLRGGTLDLRILKTSWRNAPHQRYLRHPLRKWKHQRCWFHRKRIK